MHLLKHQAEDININNRYITLILITLRITVRITLFIC